MVEVRNLANGENEPRGSVWVLVEKRAGSYFISAKANGSPINVSRAAIENPVAAIHAATKWADLLAAPVLYIKEMRDARQHMRNGAADVRASPNEG
jgi:hypothetical protein